MASKVPGQPINFDDVIPPWDKGRPGIYSHIKSHLLTGTPRLDNEGLTLPDEEPMRNTSRLKWVAGGLDGAFGHHGNAGSGHDIARNITKDLEQLLKTGDANALSSFYKLLTSNSTIDFIDPLIEQIAKHSLVHDPSLYSFAKWLVKSTPDREAMKVGIALLGICATDEDKTLFQDIGSHEEFTLYCAVALRNSAANPEVSLWQMAKAVTGWGRIHLVERLSGTRDPQIKAWLLREGYENTIMREYTALICAMTGDLLVELSTKDPDEQLLTGATRIIDALLQGGPAPGIESYPDAAQAIYRFLLHLGSRELTIEQFLIIHPLKQYLLELSEAELETAQWSSVHAQAVEMCDAIIEQPGWRDRVTTALAETDETQFWFAREAASKLNIDTWELMFRRVREGKANDWFYVMQTTDEERLRRAIQFAEDTLPLDKIATGPADELGFEPKYDAHQRLDWILHQLDRWPGHGLKLIRAGLRSPVTRNRNGALKALKAWSRKYWTDDIEQELRLMKVKEPNIKTRKLIAQTLIGSTSDD